MKEILQELFNHKTLSRKESALVMKEISEGKYSDIELSSFLTIFNMRAISVEELLGFRDALLELAVKPNLSEFDAIDIVGTGGDGKDTFNISTLSCFVVAGAGHKVVKHGNYSASSVSGSSHMLEHFGYTFTHEESELRKYLEESGLCFLHAPKFHPAMKAVVNVRKTLRVRTFFNIMGPLINPAEPKFQLFGTYNVETARLYANVLENLGKNYAVVSSLDGYDEISLTAPTKVYTPLGEELIDSSVFGLQDVSMESIKGGKSVQDNAKIFESVLKNESTRPQQDVVIANSAMAIKVITGEDLEVCTDKAKESLVSGKAYETFKKLMNK